LEDYSTKPVAYVREDRKDIIGVLMYQIMQRAWEYHLHSIGEVISGFYRGSPAKHILFYFHDDEAQKG